MDPVTVATTTLALANGTRTALTASASGGRYAWRRMRLAGTFDPTWVDISLENQGNFELTANEVAEIHEFLASDRLKPLLSFICLAVVGHADDEESEIEGVARATFLNELKVWAVYAKSKIDRKGEALWELIMSIYRGILPVAITSLMADDVEQFGHFINTPLDHVSPKSRLGGTYLRRLTSLASEMDKLVKAAEVSAEVAALISAANHDPIISHADVEHVVEFEKLYVSRHATVIGTNQKIDVDALITSGVPFRAILMGPPGAGKTTFVNHFINANAEDRKSVV